MPEYITNEEVTDEIKCAREGDFKPLDRANLSRGMCHCEDMEKEARLRLSTLMSLRLTHPVLKRKADIIYNVLVHGYTGTKHQKEFADISIFPHFSKDKIKDGNQAMKPGMKLCDIKQGLEDLVGLKGEGLIQVREYLDAFAYPFTFYEIKQIYSGNEQEVLLNFKDEQTNRQYIYNEPIEHNNRLYADPLFLQLLEKDEEVIRKRGIFNMLPTQLWFLKNIAHKLAMENTRIDEIPCTCKGQEEIALRQILPVGINTTKVICYNSCARTLFAAFKRQLKQVYPAEEKEQLEFLKFSFKFMTDTGFLDKLQNFDYSYSQWFNKMPRHKQDAMQNAAIEYLAHGFLNQRDADHIYVQFGMFCKREKQAAGGKNRAIANIDNLVKYIMGPVCWALEEFADKYFPGYCGKKNWGDLEDYMKTMYQDGFTTVLQGDGSGFDLSQNYVMRRVDRIIYHSIASKVHHVQVDDFVRAASAQIRRIKAEQKLSDAKRKNPNLTSDCGKIGHALVVGTVFSGASDTTLMNTIRMALYNHYTLQVKCHLKLGVDYHLLAKGDDFMVFVKNPNLPYKKAYDSCWMPKDKKPYDTVYSRYGIGQILKFLLIGDFSTIDFCSTTVVQDGEDFKIFRRPDRMDPLMHYSRAAVRMTPGQLKQYYIDMAMAIDDFSNGAPFYREYARACYRMSKRIIAPRVRLQTGRVRLNMPDDGHLHVHDPTQILDLLFHDYGHDYVQGLAFRHSTHKVSDEAVYEHFRKYFNFGKIEVDNMAQALLSQHLYDPIASCLPE